jgi:hypothetical protein
MSQQLLNREQACTSGECGAGESVPGTMPAEGLLDSSELAPCREGSILRPSRRDCEQLFVVAVQGFRVEQAPCDGVQGHTDYGTCFLCPQGYRLCAPINVGPCQPAEVAHAKADIAREQEATGDLFAEVSGELARGELAHIVIAQWDLV